MTFTICGVFFDYNITYVYICITSSVRMLDYTSKRLLDKLLNRV